MITATPIVNGATYLGNHLRKNDYWAEGEKQVQGEWVGNTADQLGLSDADFDHSFEALRTNHHPLTGEQLTPRTGDNRRAFYDIQFSAPKDVSVLAVIGGDDRVRQAFHSSVDLAFKELEKFAAVRDRVGSKAHLDESRLTGNVVAALFHHDSSRDLDPQLHAHAVTANLTWDQKTESWKALQTREMFAASKYVRQVMYQDLAQRLAKLGYETHSHSPDGFQIRGVEHLRDRFSKRRDQIEILKDEFRERTKREPTAKEVDVMVRESRSAKLAEATTDAVRKMQLDQLTESELRGLQKIVSSSESRKPPALPRIAASEAAHRGIAHIFERMSVARECEVLSAAYELSGGMIEGSVWGALKSHPDYLGGAESGEMTLHSIQEEEERALTFAREGSNTRLPLGDPTHLGNLLDQAELKFGVSQDEQRLAGKILCESKDSVAVLMGDAGTGKTFLLKTVQEAHLASGGNGFIALAPTSRSRDELKKEGFLEAGTIQRFLVDQRWQAQAKGRMLLIDEAGMLSTKQMGKLVEIAESQGSRLLLVGDTKQHEAVERGNALRNLIEGSSVQVARLTSVKRQKDENQRRISQLLGAGKLVEGFDLQNRLGMLIEDPGEPTLLAAAARQYADHLEAGREAVVVIPVWDEIHSFNETARAELKQRGLIHGPEIERDSVVSCSWTESQKTAWHKYEPGHVLTFHRDTSKARKGESLVVIKSDVSGLLCRDQKGREVAITKKQRSAFDVGEVSRIRLASGDKLMFRANAPELCVNNGDVLKIAKVDQGRITLDNGSELPSSLKTISYGHAVTSHKSQGASVDASILVMGHKSIAMASARQFYVSNTRHRQHHQIFLADKTRLAARLARGAKERELAREFLNRTGIGSRSPLPSRSSITRGLLKAARGFQRLLPSKRTQSPCERPKMRLKRLVSVIQRQIRREVLRRHLRALGIKQRHFNSAIRRRL